MEERERERGYQKLGDRMEGYMELRMTDQKKEEKKGEDEIFVRSNFLTSLVFLFLISSHLFSFLSTFVSSLYLIYSCVFLSDLSSTF